ncbi:ParB N-terminal domain-containing protein [Streptomyces hundungensis]|uniref:ParB N-terminal domain-containing protein n=1 Tax=Streptomyces hundungensis TaxID=1077946 RepID=UPI000EA8B65B|nr:ParB N-terminal domain-containing protein [Streptomyces hundungensis]
MPRGRRQVLDRAHAHRGAPAGLVRPAEFSTWVGARRYHERHGRYRRVLEKLRASIPKDGIREPLLLGVRAADRLVYVFEGHHRAATALELGVQSFPFRWFWDPDVQAVEHEPYSHHTLGPDGQAWLCHQEARS